MNSTNCNEKTPPLPKIPKDIENIIMGGTGPVQMSARSYDLAIIESFNRGKTAQLEDGR
jgi:hypothetical protein